MGKKRKRWEAVADRVADGSIGVEVGVYAGKMSRALLKRIPGLKLYMIDRWEQYSPEEVAGDPKARMPRLTKRQWKKIKKQAQAVAEEFPDQALIVREDSVKAADMFEDNALDFVFIDGDHSYHGCKRDIAAWFPKVKPGGWIMGHDYGLRDGVTRAVEEIGCEFETDRDKVWALRIPKPVPGVVEEFEVTEDPYE